MNQDHLPPIREPLDPGIAIAVWLLCGHGLPTVDSGDGYSKVEALDVGEAIGYGHVFIQVGEGIAADMIATATAIPWEERGYNVPTVELLLGGGDASDPDFVAVLWKPGELHKAEPGVVPVVVEDAEYPAQVEKDSSPPSTNLCGGTGQNYDPLAYEGFSGDCKGCEGCKEVEPTHSSEPCTSCEGVQFEGHICNGCGHVAGPFPDSEAAGSLTGHAATIADLQEKLSKAIEERDDARASCDYARKSHTELLIAERRMKELLDVMGIGHDPMNLYDRVLTLLPRKRVTQWLSMKLAEARLNVEQARFRHPDADDSLDVIKGAIMVEDQALWRLRRHLDGPPPAPPLCKGALMSDALALSTWQEAPIVPIPISIVQTGPDTASFQVDGVTYSVTQGPLLPSKVKMLQMGDDFYARFGRGEEVLPQIREFFRKLDAEQGRTVARCYGL